MAIQIDKSFAPDKGGQPLNAVGDDYSKYIQEASAQTGLPAHLIQAVMMAESSGDPKANSPLGESYGAGLMGMSAAASHDMGLTDVRDPRQNILKGAQYLKRQIDDFGGDVNLGLAAYNAGAEKVKRAGGVPDYTADYIQKITGKRPMTVASGSGGVGGSAAGIQSMAAGMLNNPEYKTAQAQAQKAIQESSAVTDEVIKAQDENDPRFKKIMEGVDESIEKKVPMYKPRALPEAPDPKQYMGNPTRALGQFMPVIAVLGGLATRRAAITAFKSAAAAMSAQRRNDKEDLDAAHQKWKDDTEKALKAFEMERDSYLDALEDKKLTSEERLSELHVLAAMNDSKQMKLYASMGRADLAIKYAQSMESAGIPIANLLLHAQQVDEERKRAEAARDKWQVLNDPKTGVQYRYNTMTGESTTLDMKPYTPQGAAKIGGGYARSAASLAASKFLEQHPDATAEDIASFNARLQSQAKAARDFASGKEGNLVRSFNVAVQHLDTLEKLTQALQNGDMRAINAMGQQFQQEFGQAPPTSFDAAKRIVADEVTKGILGSAGALHDRDRADESLSRASSPEQLAGVIKNYKLLMGGQLQGLKKQYESSTHFDNFDDMLLPETKAQLETASHQGSGHPLTPQLREQLSRIPPGKLAEAKKRLADAGYDVSGH